MHTYQNAVLRDGIFREGKIDMIHQYKLGGYNIVLDVCSGSVHVVDEVAYEIIALFEQNSREDVLAAVAEKFPDVADIEQCYEQVVKNSSIRLVLPTV